MPTSIVATTPPLAFSLRLWPESSEGAWRAELCGEDGVCTVFTTPLELLRHLADAAGAPAPDGGLR